MVDDDDGVTMNSALRCVPARSAVTFTEYVSLTGAVEIVNRALLAPAGTVTFAGIIATFGNGVDSPTTAPPLGALVLRVMLPVAEAPPTTELGLTDTDDSSGGVLANTVSTALYV